MNIEKGQRVVSRSGFVFQVVKLGDVWVTVKGPSGTLEHYTREWFADRFVDQLPRNKFKENKRKPVAVQGELM